jgi:hypothetical protein
MQTILFRMEYLKTQARTAEMVKEITAPGSILKKAGPQIERRGEEAGRSTKDQQQ